MVGEDVYHALVELGTLKQVSQDVVFRFQDFEQLILQLVEMLRKNKSITVAQFRDLFNTSRKYALAVLEYLDSVGVTQRDGDERRLKET